MSTNSYLQQSSQVLSDLLIIPKHKINEINHSLDDVVYLLSDLTCVIDNNPYIKSQIRELLVKEKINDILNNYEYLGSQNLIPSLVFTNQNITYMEEKVAENFYLIYVYSCEHNIDNELIGAFVSGKYYIHPDNRYKFEKFNK